MITILKGVQWTAEDERHLKYVDAEEMKAVIAQSQAEREDNRWGESKVANIRRISNIPRSMYHLPQYRRYFYSGNAEQAKELREIILNRFSGLRASKKS